METVYYRTRKQEWLSLTKFWMTLFGVNFAIGVATGIILEFEFGTNFSNYFIRVQAFSLEAIDVVPDETGFKIRY